MDNIYIERLWRSIKYKAAYLHSYDTILEAQKSLSHYIEFYNQRRPHQALGYKTPHEVYDENIYIAKVLKILKLNNAYCNEQGGEISQIQPKLLS